MRTTILSGGDPRKDFSNDVCLGVSLWERWRVALEPAGFSREAFVDVIESVRKRDLALDHRGTPMGAVRRRPGGSRRAPPARQPERSPRGGRE